MQNLDMLYQKMQDDFFFRKIFLINSHSPIDGSTPVGLCAHVCNNTMDWFGILFKSLYKLFISNILLNVL